MYAFQGHDRRSYAVDPGGADWSDRTAGGSPGVPAQHHPFHRGSFYPTVYAGDCGSYCFGPGGV